MDQTELRKLLDELRGLPKETEWVEFKGSNQKPQDIGELISALSNAACLWDKRNGYLVFGIRDKDHIVIGTQFKPRRKKVGNEELENWLATQLRPRIDFEIYVSAEYMTNKTLRERFKVDQKNYSIVSRIISDTVQAGLIKAHDPESRSKKYSKYMPFWVYLIISLFM